MKRTRKCAVVVQQEPGSGWDVITYWMVDWIKIYESAVNTKGRANPDYSAWRTPPPPPPFAVGVMNQLGEVDLIEGYPQDEVDREVSTRMASVADHSFDGRVTACIEVLHCAEERMATALFERAFGDRGLADYRREIAERPQQVREAMARGCGCFEQQQLAEAADAYDFAASYAETAELKAMALYNLALCSYEMGKATEAKAALQLAVNANPTLAEDQDVARLWALACGGEGQAG